MDKKYQKNQDIDDYIAMFHQIFDQRQNIKSDFYQIIARLLEVVANCSQFINEGDEKGIAEKLPSLFAWYCSLIVKANLNKNLSEVIWKKFPKCCPYCLISPCNCLQKRRPLTENIGELTNKAKENIDSKPRTLREWQEMFGTIYPRDPKQYDPKNNLLHLIEELGESAEAYRYCKVSNLGSELADVLTWILGVANLLDSKARCGLINAYKHYDLAECVFKTYDPKILNNNK